MSAIIDEFGNPQITGAPPQYDQLGGGGMNIGPTSSPFQTQMPVQQVPQMSREQWRDQWMGMGQITPQQADQWLQANGATQLNSKNGTWQTPYGDTLDLQIGRSAANANGGTITPGWTQINQGGNENNGVSSLMNPNSGFLQQLMQMFGNGQQQPMGAQPYNQYANRQQGQSNYFGNAPTQTNQQPSMQSSGQSDGTLLGTQMTSAAPQQSATPGMNQSNWTQSPRTTQVKARTASSSLTSESPSNQPMGAPSYYGRAEGYIPQNNMGIQR